MPSLPSVAGGELVTELGLSIGATARARTEGSAPDNLPPSATISYIHPYALPGPTPSSHVCISLFRWFEGTAQVTVSQAGPGHPDRHRRQRPIQRGEINPRAAASAPDQLHVSFTGPASSLVYRYHQIGGCVPWLMMQRQIDGLSASPPSSSPPPLGVLCRKHHQRAGNHQRRR